MDVILLGIANMSETPEETLKHAFAEIDRIRQERLEVEKKLIHSQERLRKALEEWAHASTIQAKQTKIKQDI